MPLGFAQIPANYLLGFHERGPQVARAHFGRLDRAVLALPILATGGRSGYR